MVDPGKSQVPPVLIVLQATGSELTLMVVREILRFGCC